MSSSDAGARPFEERRSFETRGEADERSPDRAVKEAEIPVAVGDPPPERPEDPRAGAEEPVDCVASPPGVRKGQAREIQAPHEAEVRKGGPERAKPSLFEGPEKTSHANPF